MLIVHVHVHVKAEAVEEFKRLTIANATQSIKEPGIARFDVMQQQKNTDVWCMYMYSICMFTGTFKVRLNVVFLS